MAQSSDSKERAARTYNAAADHYDGEALGFWDRFGRRTIERMGLRPGERVLDVGCGSGASAIPAAQAVGLEGCVIGVDLAENLLELARHKAEANGVTNVEFRAADMERLDLPDSSADAVVSVFSVFFVSDMAGLVRRLWRIVRPGGRLAVTTWGPRFCEPMNSAWWASVGAQRPDLVAAFNPWERLSTPEAVRGLLREGGVPDAEVEAENGFQELRSPDDWWSIVLGSGYRWTVEQMGPAAAERVRAANVEWARANRVTRVETNVIFAIAQKS